jgi:hypothetical protein
MVELEPEIMVALEAEAQMGAQVEQEIPRVLAQLKELMEVNQPVPLALAAEVVEQTKEEQVTATLEVMGVLELYRV